MRESRVAKISEESEAVDPSVQSAQAAIALQGDNVSFQAMTRARNKLGCARRETVQVDI